MLKEAVHSVTSVLKRLMYRIRNYLSNTETNEFRKLYTARLHINEG
jgi:hypothetical protein